MIWKRKKEEEKAYHIIGTGPFEGHRFLLRREKYGGILVIDASRLLYMNKTAMDMVLYLLHGKTEEEVIKEIRKKYRVDEDTVRKDYRELVEKVTTFIKQPDVYPVDEFGINERRPFEAEISAPYRMDLAITYRCNNKCIHCYVPSERRQNFPELSTEKWKKIIDKLVKIGVPHVTFTGGEATLRDDLIELVAYAQDAGLISGLITNGRLLKNKDYVERLVNAGIDYVQITLESARPEVHDKIVGIKGAWEETVAGIKNMIPTDVFTHTNTTLTRLNVDGAKELVHFIADLGLDTFAMNALIYSGDALKKTEIALTEEELSLIVPDIVFEAHNLDLNMWWYSPMEYCKFNPMEYGLGPRRCSAAYTSMAIEPNGDVIPCQSFFDTLGNILDDPWEKIWNHKLAVHLRERKWLPERCKKCELLNICGGGCPLAAKYRGEFRCPQHH